MGKPHQPRISTLMFAACTAAIGYIFGTLSSQDDRGWQAFASDAVAQADREAEQRGVKRTPSGVLVPDKDDGTKKSTAALPVKALAERDVYYPGTEELKPNEMRVTACGTGMPH